MIPSRSLRSSKHAHLQYTPGPRTYTRYGDRAFYVMYVAAPKLWNSLPISIRNATSIECFKSNLKRFLFNSPNLLLWPSLSFDEISLFQLCMPIFWFIYRSEIYCS